MPFNYSAKKVKDTVILDFSFSPTSTADFDFLKRPDYFSEINFFPDKIQIKVPEKKLPPNSQLNMKIDDWHQTLSLGFRSAPHIVSKNYETETPDISHKPPEESSVEEIEKRLIDQKVLPAPEEEYKPRYPQAVQKPKIKKPPVTEPQRVYSCPECGSTKLIRDWEVHEIVCTGCGFVVAEKLADRGPEWRAFDKEQREKRARAGAPQTYTIHDKGLTTVIDWHDRDIFGKKLAPGQKAQIYRLRKWNRRMRVRDGSERNLAFALSDISKIGNSLSLPKNILETASVIYRKAIKERLIRGRSIQGVTAAAIYVACRQCELARTLDEIAQASNVNKKEVARSYRFLVKELDYFISPLKPGQYVTKFSNQLTMQGKVEDIAHKIITVAKEERLTSGRGPTGIAAAASYIASVLTGEKKTQREIAEIAQVTEVTIRNRYKELVNRLQFIVSL